MEERKSTFIKHKLPCKKCGGSDPVSMNADGSAWCFSCSTRFPKYDEDYVPEETVEKHTSTFLNSYTGIFDDLQDRGISKATASKFGVRVV